MKLNGKNSSVLKMSVSNPKTTVFVGGLLPEISVELIQAAFIPFGDILKVQMPMNESKTQHRGFAFVEYETRCCYIYISEDANAALENMNLSELNGKLIKVQLARPGKYNEINEKAIWDDLEYRAELAKKDTPMDLEIDESLQEKVHVEKTRKGIF
jgi:peptidyl-prolyl isomerase E (cyclophilin E)